MVGELLMITIMLCTGMKEWRWKDRSLYRDEREEENMEIKGGDCVQRQKSNVHEKIKVCTCMRV